MPGVWISVENSSGVRYGSGPIISASEWRIVENLDGMGSFSFIMPAADPQAALLANKRRVRCFLAPDDAGSWPGGVKEIGFGIIDNIEVRPDVNGPTMIEVSGYNLLVELLNTSVGDQLNLYVDTAGSPDSVYHVITGGSSTAWSAGGAINLQADPVSYIEVRNADAFVSVTVTLGTNKNNQVATLRAEYYNESASPMAWESIDIVDGTASSGKPFKQNGTITFDIPSGWGKSTHGWYTLRLFCQDVDLDNVTFSTFSVTVRNPTTTALQDIMNLAPAGWTLDPAGELATATSVYGVLTAQSILAALNWLAATTGEHFILSPLARRVLWLGTAKNPCGLHAIDGDPGGTPDDYALYIKDLAILRTTSGLFTRIYPKGAGNGETQITLADATDSAWTGYTLNAGSNYVERDAAVTEFGRIDRFVDFPEIAPVDSSLDARKHAGNMLLQRAQETLRWSSYEQEAYELTVIPSKFRLLPGSTIYVSYHEWIDGYHAVNVEEELWILSVEAVLTPSGDLVTARLTVALVDALPMFDANRQAQDIRTNWAARTQPLPLNGLISQGTGVPYDIGVRYGQVTTIKRQTPVADGTYTPVTITITNGIITEITE